jgi:hypothetical protein
MKLITMKDNAKTAANRWFQAYSSYGDQYWTSPSLTTGKTKLQVYNELVTLGDSPDPDVVDKIIGNSSWTNCLCHECGNSVQAVVQLGQEPDYDSNTACVCFICLEKAVEIIHGM